MTSDDSTWERMSDDEPLEHSVLDTTLNSRPVVGAPVLPPDHDLTLSDGPHTTGIVDRILDGPVPLPAVEVG